MKKKILRFLKEHKLYVEFSKEFRKQTSTRIKWAALAKEDKFCDYVNVTSLDDFIKNIKYGGMILDYAFDWSMTKSGHEYWQCASDMWKKKFN